MRIYLSGPMTGHRDFNFPAFVAEARRLRALGYEVTNPAEIDFPADAQWHECMRADIAAMMGCEAIAMMPGWQKSTGAILEMNLAHRVGMLILFADEIRGVEPC